MKTQKELSDYVLYSMRYLGKKNVINAMNIYERDLGENYNKDLDEKIKKRYKVYLEEVKE